MQITGFLQNIKERPSKFGTYYSLVVDGKDHETGSKFPPKGIVAGDYITFTTAKNARGYETIVQGTLSKTTAPAGVAAPTPPPASVISMSTQDVISRQAALNSALEMVSILVAGGGVPEGKSATPAKKAEMLEAMVMSYTAKFFRINTGAEYELPEDELAAALAPVDIADQE